MAVKVVTSAEEAQEWAQGEIRRLSDINWREVKTGREPAIGLHKGLIVGNLRSSVRRGISSKGAAYEVRTITVPIMVSGTIEGTDAGGKMQYPEFTYFWPLTSDGAKGRAKRFALALGVPYGDFSQFEPTVCPNPDDPYDGSSIEGFDGTEVVVRIANAEPRSYFDSLGEEHTVQDTNYYFNKPRS